MDDELNILPTSTKVKFISPLNLNEDGKLENDPSRVNEEELKKV